MTDWLILTLVSLLAGATATIFQKKVLSAHETDPVMFSVVFQVLVGLLFIPIMLTQGQIDFSTVPDAAPNFFLAMVLYGFGEVFLFMSLKGIDASRYAVLAGSHPLFTIVASSLLLGQTLQDQQLFGVAILFFSLLLVSIRGRKQLALRIQPADLLALFGAAFLGFAITNDAYAIGIVPLYVYLVIAFTLPGLFIAVIYYRRLPKLRDLFEKQVRWKVLTYCLLYTVQAYTFYQAIVRSQNSSVIAGITLLSMPLSSILAIIFLRERQNIASKLIASLLGVFGLLLLSVV